MISQLLGWLNRGKNEGAAFLLVVCDTFEHEDYPVFVRHNENLAERARAYHLVNMQKVMECYDLNKDFDLQLKQARSWNGWKPHE